jgi:hypothetical protein
MELHSPTPQIWDLTYVNRVPKSEHWNSPSDWPKVFPGLWGGEFAKVDGVELRGFQGQWVWETSEPFARLYVEPKPWRSTDQPPKDVLLLSLTARGRVDVNGERLLEVEDAISAIEAGMNCGHALIVTVFDKLASDDAKRAWGRHVDSDR